MKFKSIFFITIILLTILSISAVSADDMVDEVNIVGADLSADNVDIIGNESSTGDESASKSSIDSSDLTKYYKNDSQYEATFYDNNGTPIVGQKIPIAIHGGNYQRTTNENGSIKFPISLPAGPYTIKVTNPVTNETASNKVIVLSTINGSDVSKYYKNGTQYYVTVFDGQGNPSANTKVSLNINGVFYNRTTNASGVAKMNINLNSGKYTITAENLNNGEKISNKITVLPTISGKNIKKYYKNGTQYFANFTDNQGNPLKNTVVQFNINGVFYNRTTNENGTAKLNINLNAGKYVLTAINPNTTEQLSNNVEVLSKIIAKNSRSGGNISIEYNNNAKYTVEVHEDDGSLAKNKPITFNINGVIYKRTTDANGTASITINLLPNNYIVTAEYNGYKESNTLKVRVTPDIKIINTTVKTGDYIRFKLTEHVSGKPVTGQHYGVVHYNGTTYGNYPNAEGIVQIRVGLPAGTQDIFYIGMLDDGWYAYKIIGNTIKIV